MGFKKDLPLTSSHWGTYRAKVNNGKVTELIGWENDKDPSPIGPGIVDIHDNKTRIDKPMIRKSWIDNGPGTNNNLRGIEPFVAVSWDEAENIVAKELNRVKKNFGNFQFFEKYILEININIFKIRVIKFAIKIGVEEIL